MKRYLALAMPLLLATGIIILTLRLILSSENHRSAGSTGLYVAMTVLYLLWILAETRIARRDSNEKQHAAGPGTREYYAASRPMTILPAQWFKPALPRFGSHHVVGSPLFIAGVGCRLWAVHSLGEHYSHLVRPIDGHQVVDSGPYRFVRHPAYAGMIIAHPGTTLYFSSIPALRVLLLALVPSIILRIRIEERMLSDIEGYAEYAMKHGRLVPGVWQHALLPPLSPSCPASRRRCVRRTPPSSASSRRPCP
ncbi:MAG TPA: isoprenylcysteine carboxylmethyltransferase family protein [Spirochaetota bacterium]|nr:isoprenylcysteine carboxylmethyltransferase family protein [Spirochaetota bacterium]